MFFTEIYPIDVSTIPCLFAYKLELEHDDLNTVGWKFAHRLRKEWGGIWVFCDKLIVGNQEKESIDFQSVLTILWKDETQNTTYRHLQKVNQLSNWKATPSIISCFVANGLCNDLFFEITNTLNAHKKEISDVVVKRDYFIRDWVIQNIPCISISIRSELSHKHNFVDFLKLNPNFAIEGLRVKDRDYNTKGEVVSIIGNLAQHRERLMAFKPKEKTLYRIKNGQDDESIVTLKSYTNFKYDYPSSALDISVLMADLYNYKTNVKEVVKNLKISPAQRVNLIGEVAKHLKEKKWISKPLNNSTENIFLENKYLCSPEDILMGNGVIVPYNEKMLMKQLKANGLYKSNPDLQKIKVAILTTVEISSTGTNVAYTFLSNLKEEFKGLNIELQSMGKEQLKSFKRSEISKALQLLVSKNPDIVLAILPDESVDSFQENYTAKADDSLQNAEEEHDAYYHLKSLCIRDNIQSQVVTTNTLGNKWALGNIVMGILAKVGNIPYVLAKPLDFADLVIGIDVARKRKSKGGGSINTTAVARIYFSNGDFMRYAIHDALLEGETIPKKILEALFPLSEFGGKRIIIHRDGVLRGNELKDLKNWANEIGSEFYVIEVIKSGSPRIYSKEKDQPTKRPPKGTILKINDKEALVVSSLPPFEDATPQPLHIRTDGSIKLEDALRSVLSLTYLHYGSLRSPRLPVTVHYSDKIAGMALEGIKPKNLEGNIPYWL